MLGDFFPEENKLEYINSILSPGHILRFFIKDTNPPKIKILLIVGSDEENLLIAYLYINTDINLNVHRTAELYDLQYEIIANENNKLDYSSFVDCSDVMEANKSKLQKMIFQDLDLYRGKIKPGELNDILSKIENTHLIELEKKQKFGFLT